MLYCRGNRSQSHRCLPYPVALISTGRRHQTSFLVKQFLSSISLWFGRIQSASMENQSSMSRPRSLRLCLSSSFRNYRHRGHRRRHQLRHLVSAPVSIFRSYVLCEVLPPRFGMVCSSSCGKYNLEWTDEQLPRWMLSCSVCSSAQEWKEQL